MHFKVVFVFLIAIMSPTKAQRREGDSCTDQYTNTIGKCKPADNCISARNDFQQNGIRPTFCTYSAFGTTLVCCRDGVSILHTAGTKTVPPVWSNDDPNRQADSRRVSERSDNEMTSPKSTDEDTKTGNDYEQKELQFTAKYPLYMTTEQAKPNLESIFIQESEEELLSKLWGKKLKKLTSDQRRLAEKIINDVIFKAEMKELTSDTVNLIDAHRKCAEGRKIEPTPLKINSGDSEDDKEDRIIKTPIVQIQLKINKLDDRMHVKD